MIILLIFGFGIYIASNFGNSETQQQAERIVTSVLETTNLKTYVTLCLEESAEKSLIILGEQGGNIYSYQGSTGIPNRTADISGSNVSYANVLQGTNFPPEVAFKPRPWQYPYIGPLHESPSAGYPIGAGVYGKNTLSRLCDSLGSNSITQEKYMKCPSYDEPNNPNDKTSVQEQLQKHIKKNLEKCIRLEELIGNRTDIEQGEMEVNVIFSRESFAVQLKYPLKIEIAKRKPIIEIIDFEAKIPVRLMRIYELANTIIDQENLNLFFKTNDKLSTLRGFDGFMEVTVNITSPRDKIMIIKDERSIVNNTFYKMQFILENRIPALDWIGYPQKRDGADIIIIEGEELKIEPQGYDPDDTDETELRYDYKGWKQDYNDVFYEEEYSSAVFNPEILVERMQPISQENTWKASDLWLLTNKSANLTMTRKDLGYHHFEVRVTDPENLKDWQNITVKVVDIPEVNANASSTYDDIQEIENILGKKLASVEDFYKLEGEVLGIYTTIQNAYWTDISLTPNRIYENITQTVPTDANITNITKDDFKLPLGTHEFVLRVDAIGVPAQQKQLEIEVYECLPHRSDDLIYPYSSGNAFQANHTCCIASEINNPLTWEIQSIKKCIQETYYTCHPNVMPNINGEYGIATKTIIESGDQFIDATVIPNAPTDFNSQNDIFNRIFEQRCGSRGNICSGQASDVWQSIVQCDSPPTSGTQTESCSGPALKPEECNYDMDLACIDYPTGETFEKNFDLFDRTGIKKADGICNEVYECCTYGEPPEKDRYNNKGNRGLECQAQCDGEGDCTSPVNVRCGTSCGANYQCDKQQVGFKPGTCNTQSFYEDECSSSCELQSDASKFHCTPSDPTDSCFCGELLCDGNIPGTAIQTCASEETYFADKCSSTASGIDRDITCRSTAFHSSCTASSQCNGITRSFETASCSFGKGYFKDYCPECQVADKTDLCISDGLCTANQNCNGATPNTPYNGGFCFAEDSGDEHGCTGWCDKEVVFEGNLAIKCDCSKGWLGIGSDNGESCLPNSNYYGNKDNYWCQDGICVPKP